jgi:hypothetical protein
MSQSAKPAKSAPTGISTSISKKTPQDSKTGSYGSSTSGLSFCHYSPETADHRRARLQPHFRQIGDNALLLTGAGNVLALMRYKKAGSPAGHSTGDLEATEWL